MFYETYQNELLMIHFLQSLSGFEFSVYFAVVLGSLGLILGLVAAFIDYLGSKITYPFAYAVSLFFFGMAIAYFSFPYKDFILSIS